MLLSEKVENTDFCVIVKPTHIKIAYLPIFKRITQQLQTLKRSDTILRRQKKKEKCPKNRAIKNV